VRVFGNTASNFTVYYIPGKSGFGPQAPGPWVAGDGGSYPTAYFAGPKITVPAVSVTEASGPNGAVVSFASRVSAMDCFGQGLPWSATPSSGWLFPIGTTLVSVSATDQYGQSSVSTFGVTVRDTTAPALSGLAANPNPAAFAQAVTVKVTATDVASKIASAEYKLDAAATWKPMTAVDGAFNALSEVASVTLTGLASGNHTIAVRTTDARGNASAASSMTVTVKALSSGVQSVGVDLGNLLPTLNTRDQQRIRRVIGDLNDALAPSRWIDSSHPKPGSAGVGVYASTGKAIVALRSMAADKTSGLAPAQIRAYIDRLVATDRASAALATDEAMARDGRTFRIRAARVLLSAGDALAARGFPDAAVAQYEIAWLEVVGS
jgi:hypothetical protein